METIPSVVFAGSRCCGRGEPVTRLQASSLFRDYQRAFQVITSLPLVLRAAGSFQLGLAESKNGNACYALLTASSKTCALLLQLQQRLELISREKPGTLEILAGLHESAVPVRVGGQVIAYLQTGQVLFQRPTFGDARKAVRPVTALDAGLNSKALEAAYRGSRVMNRSRYDALLGMLEIFAQQLAERSNQILIEQSLAENPTVVRARTFIVRHLAEDLTLPQVSRAVGMNSCYFCKSFKRHTGLTFTDYVARLRVEAVKRRLLDPFKRVSEAAFESGFQSLSQFNRVFRRIDGRAPSTYREQLHAAVNPSSGRRHPPAHAA